MLEDDDDFPRMTAARTIFRKTANMRSMRAIAVVGFLCMFLQASTLGAPAKNEKYPFWRLLRNTAQESCDRFRALHAAPLPLHAGHIAVGTAEDSYVVACAASDGVSSMVPFTLTVEPCPKSVP
jgi:hypothetical protein